MDKEVFNKATIVVGLSTAASTIGRAKEILSIIKKRPSDEKLLSACSAILAATALEQMTRDSLSTLAKNQEVADEIPYSTSPAGIVLDDCLRNRVRLLPEILSNGRFVFNERCRKAKDLHKLITLRNMLLHIKETIIVEKGESQNVIFEDNKFSISIPIPDDVWDSIDSNKAQRLLEAVNTYYEEVVMSGEMKSGQLVCLSS